MFTRVQLHRRPSWEVRLHVVQSCCVVVGDGGYINHGVAVWLYEEQSLYFVI